MIIGHSQNSFASFAVLCVLKRESRAKTDGGPSIVILGGGFGGLFTTLDLAGRADVTLVSDDHFLFTPMLYEYLSGEWKRGISPQDSTGSSTKATCG